MIIKMKNQNSAQATQHRRRHFRKNMNVFVHRLNHTRGMRQTWTKQSAQDLLYRVFTRTRMAILRHSGVRFRLLRTRVPTQRLLRLQRGVRGFRIACMSRDLRTTITIVCQRMKKTLDYPIFPSRKYQLRSTSPSFISCRGFSLYLSSSLLNIA